MSSTLPRGPHRLSPEEVRESQRARLLTAMLDLVGTHGWAKTTVPQVVARARVSRNAFYELFSDKADCYLAAVEDEVAELLEAQRPPRPDMGWRELLEHAMGVYLAHWQARPEGARAYLVEMPQVGAPAVEQRARTYEVFAEQFCVLAGLVRVDRDDLPPVTPIAVRAAVTAITEEVTREVRAGRLDTLHTRHREFCWLVVRLLADDTEAEHYR